MKKVETVHSLTSTQDSGLLDVLLPAFTEMTGYNVQLIAVGSGQALKIGEEGNADVILLHSPDAEKEFVAKGFGVDRRRAGSPGPAASTTVGTLRFTRPNGLVPVAGGALAAPGRAHGRLRFRYIGGRRLDDGGWEYSRTDAGPDDRYRA